MNIVGKLAHRICRQVAAKQWFGTGNGCIAALCDTAIPDEPSIIRIEHWIGRDQPATRSFARARHFEMGIAEQHTLPTRAGSVPVHAKATRGRHVDQRNADQRPTRCAFNPVDDPVAAGFKAKARYRFRSLVHRREYLMIASIGFNPGNHIPYLNLRSF